MADSYEQAQAEFDQAAVRFTNEKAKLFRADGSAVYADQVYDEKVAALTAELHAVAEKVHGVAEREIAEVNRRQEAEHDDPITRLTVQEQQAASARAVFVKEDAMLLPLADLTRRLRGVSAAGKDKVNSYLWSRYARQRIEAIKTASADSGRPTDPAMRAQLGALTEAIVDLESVLGVANALTKSQAAQRIGDARTFKSALQTRVSELDGSQERLVREMRQRMPVW